MNISKDRDVESIIALAGGIYHDRINQEKLQDEDFCQRVYQRSIQFHEEVVALCKDHQFLKAIKAKCLSRKNCFEPFEVIGEAYIIGQVTILNGKEIRNTEAWLRITIWNLLCNKGRTDYRKHKKIYSFDSSLANSNGKAKLSLLEKTPSGTILDCPYYTLELEEETRLRKTKYKRVKTALKSLTREERHLLDLWKVQGKPWKQIAKLLGFNGKLATLRKQGERTMNKLKTAFYKQL